MDDTDYFLQLYEIASHLNKEFSLHSALHKSLEKTAEILGLETGWIWLTEPDQSSVYLAASYNLPPALSNHPERLSGWCYCIKQYLDDDIDEAMNISEITCSRLKDINTGTKGLKFHAVIPIFSNQQKVGLMNLLSKETRELQEKELTLLNTISELVGTAIHRTRLNQSYQPSNTPSKSTMARVMDEVIQPQLESLVSLLNSSKSEDAAVKSALQKAKDVQKQLSQLTAETKKQEATGTVTKELQYPNTPLTKRELEVLQRIKNGRTNNTIGEQLYITERTVKFHVTSILSKLNAKTRTEAVDIALKRGLLNS